MSKDKLSERGLPVDNPYRKKELRLELSEPQHQCSFSVAVEWEELPVYEGGSGELATKVRDYPVTRVTKLACPTCLAEKERVS